MIEIRFDRNCTQWDSDMEYNTIFMSHIIKHYKLSYDLHCLNDIYERLGLKKTIAGYKKIWDGPIEIKYEKFNDHIIINIVTEPMKESRDEQT